MLDLEIRGAGNLLGGTQSGHIAAVGYDLYCQMVSEAVAELKGEEVEVPAEVKIEVPLDANLPPDYVTREDLRLEAYRRLATVRTQAEVDDIRAEWQDRYGPPPERAEALLSVARLRAECHRTGVREVIVGKGPGFGGPKWVAKLMPLHLPESKKVRLQRLYKESVYKPDPAQLQLPLRVGRAEVVDAVVAALGDLVPQATAE